MSHRMPEPDVPDDLPAAPSPVPAEPHAHSHGHVHVHATGPVENLTRYAKPAVVGVLVASALAVVLGMFFLWPGHSDHPIPLQFRSADGGPLKTADAVVVAQTRASCDAMPDSGTANGQYPNIPGGGGPCIASTVKLTSGPDNGHFAVLMVPTNAAQSGTGPDQTADTDPAVADQPQPGQPTLHVDDKLRLSMTTGPDGATRYAFFDFRRGSPLIVWAAAFAFAVIAVATWRGVRAIIALVFAFAVLGFFTLPSILDGHNVVAVAVVSSALILFVVLYLAHGFNLRTSSALLGTLVSLLLAGLLSYWAIKSLSLTGLSGENTASLQLYQGSISLSGLLLAGFVIGTLGVLNDVTITQASATFELAAMPGQTRLSAFRAAMRVGRDHIASTVYTLVFAYAGSALPLLLLFSVAAQPFSSMITGEEVAIELARTFVGGIALAMSVPFTTAIAASLVALPTSRRAAAH
ncbi:MAG: YibE/F family protein [Gordonia sp. (in: high G+C Gram-positive bacteria)]